MDTAISSIVDIPLMPTPSTSSASPSVELRQDYEAMSGNTTDLSSAHTSPDEVRNSQVINNKDCEPINDSKSNIADSLKASSNKKQPARSVVYESQISPELGGIKIKIKKSPKQEMSTAGTAVGTAIKRKPKVVRVKEPKGRAKAASTKGRKTKKRKKGQSDNEDAGGTDSEDDEEEFYYGYNGAASTVSFSADSYQDDDDVKNNRKSVQSIWANERMPPEILTKIFMEVTYTEGCVPTLVRLSRVCRLWWQVSTGPMLWHSVDLSSGRTVMKHRTEHKLFWLLENRLLKVQDLSLGGWNSALTRRAIEGISSTCKDLRSLSLTGCKGVTGESMLIILQNCKAIQKLDLSAISPFTYNPKGAISSTFLCEMAKLVASRLTHLNLANNCTTGVQLVVAALATSCPNLELLDLSNLKMGARDTICINIEQLQQGCPKLRVFRLTNSLIRLSATPLKDQAVSPGFPNLEELSIAVDPKSCTSMDNASMERIVKNAHKLRLLDVRGCSSITNSALVRVPAWDLEHLFLSGCTATRQSVDGLELVVRKWRHSLVEIDLSWVSITEALDAAVSALAEEIDSSPLKILDLCGSSVSFAPVRLVLCNCTRLRKLNLSSCRALPRGIKRLYDGVTQLTSLREAIRAGRFDGNQDDD